MAKDYQELLERYAELSDLEGIAALMGWDQETYMPDGGQPARGRQMALLSGLIHNRFTDPQVGQLLQKLSADGFATGSDEALSIERVSWAYEREKCLPEKLVREMTRAQSEAVACWEVAREQNDFAKFQPHLEKLLDLSRQTADLLKADGQSRYDALLSGYERGCTAAQIEPLFAQLKTAVVSLLERIGQAEPVDTAVIDQSFDVDSQWRFGLEVLGAMGFDFNCGRLDKSTHPFTTSFDPTDVRITTRLDPKQFCMALFGTLHEGGHALYDQGIAALDFGTPLGKTISLGIHESQSRMWENLVGRSPAFWSHFYPRLQKHFPDQVGSVPREDFYRAIHEVRPSLIRVESDEVTYSLHIILRFELEHDMLEGRLDVADLPEAWNTRFREGFGFEVPDDAHGCMQDIHWAWGMFGYFPTYTLGNVYASQMFAQAQSDIENLDDNIAQGNLTVLTDWLRQNVHHVGQRRLAPELIEDITGGPLDAQPYINYLEKKYCAIYNF